MIATSFVGGCLAAPTSNSPTLSTSENSAFRWFDVSTSTQIVMVFLASLVTCIIAFAVLRWILQLCGCGRIRANISDKVVLLTGAGGGLGRALAQQLAKQGCRLALVDVVAEPNEESARLVRAALGREDVVKTYVADLRKRDAISKLVDKVVADFSRVDILVSNAGILECGSLEGFLDDTVDAMFDVNLLATVRLTRALLPHMRQSGGGHIVAVSSAAAHIPSFDMTLYCASKAGLTHFMEALYIELRRNKDPIYITTVHPSFIRTSSQLNCALELNKWVPVMKSEDAATRIVSAITNREIMVFMPWYIKLGCGMTGLWPRSLRNLLYRFVSGSKVTRIPFNYRHRRPSISLVQDCLASGHDLVDDPTDALKSLMGKCVSADAPLPFDFAPHVDTIRNFYTDRKRDVPEVVKEFIAFVQQQAAGNNIPQQQTENPSSRSVV